MADLRLDTAAGRRVAHARLQQAAEQVCGPAPSHLGDLESVAAFEACRRTALQDAEQRLVEAEAAARPVLASAIASR
jgi:UrcA family protein